VLAKFIYNNLYYSTIGISLFFTLYAFYLSIEFHVRDNVLEGEALIVIK
jgi:hypothetical protein